MSIVETVLRQMSSVLKPQRTFLVILLTTLIYLPGKANFRNLSRYSHLHEKTYSRGFRRDFDFVKFNRLSLADIIANNSTWVVAIGWKIRKFNEHLLKRFSSFLGLDFSSIKSSPEFGNLCNYGAIAA
ncbi:MAG: hypothetical protein IPL99_17345 [Candidatus Competibacteraceae bacterium]|nr:hypothetical protein [Candidatus Competibacteraceae bacterium]